MFSPIKNLVAAQWAFLQSVGTLLTVDPDRDEIWQMYLGNFEIDQQQEHQCSSCKSFIRQVGGVVAVDGNGIMHTLWDIPLEEIPAEYRESISALAVYVHSKPIAGFFYQKEPSAGVDKNWDPVREIFWEHFHAEIPKKHVGDLGPKAAQYRGNFDVLSRALKEIDPGAVQTVLELIDQGSLYRGPEYRHLVEGLKAKLTFTSAPGFASNRLDGYVWHLATTLPDAECRIGNTAIGTLLYDLSEGKDLETAVKAFERMVAPANYKRPAALVTPRMVEQAKERLNELGLISALDRRQLDSRDLTAANALFVYRPKVKKGSDVFAEIAGEQAVDVKKFGKVEEIGIADFISKVVPTAKSLRVLFERSHLGNLATLTGPQDPDAPQALMKWDNSFGWSYTGGVADSIKEKVKAAGGNVEGWGRISLAWTNYDDLDLHFAGAGFHVYYADKRGSFAELDVDMNAGMGRTREPVENVFIPNALPPGKYEIGVHQFNNRDTADKGYELEVVLGDEAVSFSSVKSPREKATDRFAFTVAKDGSVAFAQTGQSKAAKGVVKWGLKTGQWHTVKALTLSPNHWTKPVGNKHYFFLLEGAVADEKVRPFYNEFLTEALSSDRKVTEILGSKIEVAKADGAELSGLGFSETIRNSLYVEVEGSFKRIVKVNF